MIAGIIDGIKSYGGALRYTSRHRLWGYFLIPALICLIFFFVVGFSVFSYSGSIGQFLLDLWPFSWGEGVISKIGTVFSGILLTVAGLLTFKYIVLILSAPFMSLLSEKVEKIELGESSQPAGIGSFVKSLLRGLRISSRNLLREILLTLLIMILGLFPIVGLVSTVLIFIVQAYYAGFGNMDFALERFFNVRESVRFVRDHRGFAIGNGLVFIGMIATVVGVLFVIPLSTISSTLYCLDQLEE